MSAILVFYMRHGGKPPEACHVNVFGQAFVARTCRLHVRRPRQILLRSNYIISFMPVARQESKARTQDPSQTTDSRGSSVGIVTVYGLDDQVLIPYMGQEFLGLHYKLKKIALCGDHICLFSCDLVPATKSSVGFS